MEQSRIYHAGDYPPLKPRKATQACNQCRKRRRRCEGGQPCLGCLENCTDCVFDDNDRPPESLRRALRHAQQHANKVEALSQRLDQLTHQLNTIAKRNETTLLASKSHSLQPEPHLSEGQSMTTTQCSVEKWPEVCAMLWKACVPEEAICVGGATSKAGAITNLSVFEVTCNSRKRKRARQCTTHLDCARYDQHSISNDGRHISRSRADALIQSYVQDIHSLYPIADLAQLARVLNRLEGQHHIHFSAIQLQHIYSRLNNPNTSPSVESMSHALLYIILALGEMCQRRKSSRSSAQTTSLDTEHVEYQPYSPVSTIFKGTLPTDSPRCSSSGVQTQGVQFYERATRIMGLHLDGNNLIHAQVAMLAGLYKGLAGRATESLNWISTAGRVIENLLRSWKIVGHPLVPRDSDQCCNNGHYLLSEHDSKMRKLILLNAWTCIQIERDMQCDTELPQSGILVYEDILPLPGDNFETETEGRSCKKAFPSEGIHRDDLAFMHYAAELKLRKRMAYIQRQYLSDQCLKLSSEQLCRALRHARKALEDWRFNLPNALQWSDDRRVSSDISSMKLRMKYYNGLSDIYRPYLDYALHIRPYHTTMRDVCTLAVDSDGNARSKAEIYVFQVLARMPDCEIRHAIACCLQSAFCSVRTFLGTASRLLPLEFYSFASIHYENILMLCAAYMAPATRSMIRLDDLVELASSSIAFFKERAVTSEWCSNTAGILQRILAIILDAEY